MSACAGHLVDMSLIRPAYSVPVCQKSHNSECQELQQDSWKTKDGIDLSHSFPVHSLPSFDQCVGDAEEVPWNRSGSGPALTTHRSSRQSLAIMPCRHSAFQPPHNIDTPIWRQQASRRRIPPWRRMQNEAKRVISRKCLHWAATPCG